MRQGVSTGNYICLGASGWEELDGWLRGAQSVGGPAMMLGQLPSNDVTEPRPSKVMLSTARAAGNETKTGGQHRG